MSEKKRVGVSLTVSLPSAIRAIEDLLASLKAGTVCIIRGDEYVTLKPENEVDLEISGVDKKGKGSLKLELAWRRHEVAPEIAEESFVITSTEPPPPAEPVAAIPDETNE
ncbi:MAG: amphi-Trp domain-containing protein [Nitrospinae bacterium]|nr:amphi-Trp domain-containing protein [Nitrospinota bacterium]